MPASSFSATAVPELPETRHRAILFENVAVEFEGRAVLDGISFQLLRGESKVLLGVTGTGKSTILKLALGLIQPQHGRVVVLGHEVTKMSEEELFEVRRHVGMVFQESALFDSLTVYDNVAYRLHEEHDIPEAQVEERVREALRFVELEDTLEKMPAELSGGMRRRVAIARALVDRPEAVLFDSPTGGLDPVTSTTIIELVVKQRDLYRTSSLLVTQRLQDALVMATHHFDANANQMRKLEPGSPVSVHTSFLMLRDGRVIFDGSLAALVNSTDPYIRDFIT
jgi:phospholipid/cholesterol/gamma-HCH transport system ATP-binding protein